MSLVEPYYFINRANQTRVNFESSSNSSTIFRVQISAKKKKKQSSSSFEFFNRVKLKFELEIGFVSTRLNSIPA